MNCGNSMEKVKLKLQELKQALKEWKEQVFNSDKVRKQKILENLKN